MINEIQKEVTTKGDNVISAFFRAETLSSKENNQILRQMNAKESLPKHVLPELVLFEGLPKQGESQLSSPSKPAAGDKTQDKASSKPTDMGYIVRRDIRVSMSGTLPKDSTVSNPGTLPKDSTVSNPGTLPKDSTVSNPGTLPKDSTVSNPHPRLAEARMPLDGNYFDSFDIDRPRLWELLNLYGILNDGIRAPLGDRDPYAGLTVKIEKGNSQPKY